MSFQRGKIAWLSTRLAIDLASFRLRSFVPGEYLRTFAYESDYFSDAESIAAASDKYDYLIINKVATPERLALATRFRRAGKPIIYDLCDPVFLPGFRGGKGNEFAEADAMIAVASAVTVNGSAMAEMVRQRARADLPIHVIEDPVLTREQILTLYRTQVAGVGARPHKIWGQSSAGPWPRRMFDRIGQMWRDHLGPRRHRLVWFGRAGDEYAGHAGTATMGMAALVSLLPVLREIDRHLPLELIILSNSYPYYRHLFCGSSIATRYMEWSLFGFYDVMASADLCLMPVGGDSLAQMSSGNRIAQALATGVPVVRGKLQNEAYLESCTWMEDWANGIRAYLTDSERRADDLSQAQRILETYFSPQSVAGQWDRLLRTLTNQHP